MSLKFDYFNEAIISQLTIVPENFNRKCNYISHFTVLHTIYRYRNFYNIIALKNICTRVFMYILIEFKKQSKNINNSVPFSKISLA